MISRPTHAVSVASAFGTMLSSPSPHGLEPETHEVRALVCLETWLWLQKVCIYDDEGHCPDIELFIGNSLGHPMSWAKEASLMTLRKCFYAESDNTEWGSGLVRVKLVAASVHKNEDFDPSKLLPHLTMWLHRETE